MIQLCFCYPRSNHTLNQWDYVLTSFPVDDLFIIGPPDTPMKDSGSGKRATLIQTAEELPDTKLVVITPKEGRFVKGKKALRSYKHPKKALYLFGNDHLNLCEEELGIRKPDQTVYIETESPHELYAHVAAALVLYDRIRKDNGKPDHRR